MRKVTSDRKEVEKKDKEISRKSQVAYTCSLSDLLKSPSIVSPTKIVTFNVLFLETFNPPWISHVHLYRISVGLSNSELSGWHFKLQGSPEVALSDL